MKKINILYIGRHPEILETVVRLINKNENWNAIGTESNIIAIQFFMKINFSIVLLGCGIPQDDENRLREIFSIHNPECKIVQHYGGGSGLLNNEILSALENNYA